MSAWARHGHLTRVTHEDEELFAGIPQEFVAVRYHSLRVEEPLPAELIPTAWAEDGVIMALRHRHLPRWGVQFHPESIASRYGRELLANFRDLSIDSIDAKVKSETRLVVVAGSAAAADRAVQTPPASSLRLITTVMPKAVDTEAVFLEFFESSPTCFWLDSSRVEAGLSRFSFLGDASGPLSEVLSYRISTGAVTVADADGVRVESGSIFDVLERRLRERQLADPDLPFDFSGGYVGYFGYELKTDCGAGNQHSSDTPDAIWIFADRLVAVDHEIGLTYVLAVTRRTDPDAPGRRRGFRAAPDDHCGVELPVYRGHMVNSPEPDPEGRRPDPRRLLVGYRAASEVMGHLGWRGASQGVYTDPPVWTSHEALSLDYEIPMLRRDEEGRFTLTSTHWPWIGERTRQIDGAHLELLADVVNPVACKVGPRLGVAELLALCERLDPEREPGRLTLIARMGAEVVTELLPPLVRAVRVAGHPAIWLVDPTHANTVTTSDGVKTRFVDTLIQEVRAFQVAVRAAGGTAGGIHLETTPDDVTECVSAECSIERIGEKYTTLCDSRLNPRQAVSVVSAWSG